MICLDKLFEKSPDYCLEPLMAAAYYSAFLNFSPAEYESYFKDYKLKIIKYKFDKGELIPKTFYHKDAYTILLSSNEHDLSTIASYSSNITYISGWDKELLIGKTLSSLLCLSPSVRRIQLI